MGWATMRASLHRLAINTFSDGAATYTPVDPGAVPCPVPSVMVDRGLTYEGAEGRFVSDQVGITWLVKDLAKADRGGVFAIDGERFQVDQILSADGHAITAATTPL